MMLKTPVFVLCTLGFASLSADVFAISCLESGVVQQENHFILNDPVELQPQLFEFCNPSSEQVSLDRVAQSDPGVQAGWASQLAPHSCSVLMLYQQSLTFECRSDSEKPCGEYVSVCHLLSKDIPADQAGNF